MSLINKSYSYEEIQDIIEGIDLMNRIYIGQYDMIFNHIVWNNKSKKILSWHDLDLLSASLYQIRSKLIPSLKDRSHNASLGIWSPKTPKIAIKGYDVLQVLRYQKSYYFCPEGDIGVCFDTPLIQGNWKIDTNSLYEFRERAKKFNDNYVKTKYRFKQVWDCPVVINFFYDDYCTVRMSKGVQSIINKGLKVKKMIEDMDITEVFTYLYPKTNKNEYSEITDFISCKLKEMINFEERR